MLELPEAVTLASQFEKAYQGKVITRAVAGYTPHKFAFYEGDPADYPSRLEGKTVGGSASFGGHAMMIAGDMRLGFSDGVNARYLAPDEERPAKHQLLLDFDDGSSLVCTISMYGFFGLCRADDQGNEYFQAAKGKPSPLSDAPMSFTTTQAPAWANCSAISRPIPPPAPVTTATLPRKGLLMDSCPII